MEEWSEKGNTGLPTRIVDEVQYSRQIYALGRAAVLKIAEASVTLIGAKGVGSEVGKCLALAGVKAITIVDDSTVQESDLSASPFFQDSDVGHVAAAVSAEKIAALNENVSVKALSGPLGEEAIRESTVVVATDSSSSFEELASVNVACRRQGVPFIVALSHGLVSCVFADLGDEFEVADASGEPQGTLMVENITQDCPATVTVAEDHRHGLEEGDHVEFSGIKGIAELNSGGPRAVTVTGPSSFTVADDTRACGRYISGGYIHRAPRAAKWRFQSLERALESPKFCSGDARHLLRSMQLHAAITAVDAIRQRHHQGDDDDVLLVLDLAKKLLEKYKGDARARGEEVAEAEAEAAPPAPSSSSCMDTSDDASIPTEGEPRVVLPAAAGSADLDEALVRHILNGWGKVVPPVASYTGGVAAQEVLKACTGHLTPLHQWLYFDALDCLPPLPLPPEECAPSGGRHDAQVSILGRSLQEKLGNLRGAGVMSAVDSAAARYWIDARCVFVPYESEMYASTQDPPEHREFPICTVTNFPYAPEHALRWALDAFAALFTQRPQDVNAYLGTRDYVPALRKQPPAAQLPVLELLQDSLLRHRPLGFEACVEWARLQFEELFSNNIKQLCFNFPLGMTTSAGTPFWSGTKRAPTPLLFDAGDALHLDFIVAAANLQATVYGLKGCRDRAVFAPALRSIQVPAFQPKEGVKIAVTDSELRAGHGPQGAAGGSRRGGDDSAAAAECERFLQKLPTPASLVGYRLTAVSYDPDDELTYTADFVAAAAALRALNYGIPPCDKLLARLQAGNVVPALITTATAVGGLMALELVKLVQQKPLAAHKHSYFNLALPLFTSAQPLPAVKTKVATRRGGTFTWTLWDRFELDGSAGMTLKSLLSEFEKQHGLEITMLSHGKSLLYAEFVNKKKLQERLPMTLTELVASVAKTKVPPTKTHLTFSIACTDATDDDIEVPDIRVKIK
eukprot:jgi/Mesen1/5922/ME000030S05186